MTVKPYVLLLCAVFLMACERSDESKPVTEVSVEQSTEASIEPAPAIEPAVDALEAPTHSAKPVVKAKVAEPETPVISLDLSVPKSLILESTPPDAGAEPAPILPPLFNKKNDVSPYEISGRLLSNEAEENYFDSVEGAEVKIEFRQ